MEYFYPFSNELFERKWNAKTKKERFKGGAFIDPDEEQWKQNRKDLYFKRILEFDPWEEPHGAKRRIQLIAQSAFD
ncbi:hypothetical protein ACRASX_16325 (plasmid) [Flavobacterium sp. TMP13]|uniref:hypothetical protein n=1 Tax=Flavobacterium sp. TMP13 TaxID=3425950 RepID=UPI003D7762CE